MNRLGVPLDKVEKMVITEIDKWAAAAVWIASEIDLAPWKTKK